MLQQLSTTEVKNLTDSELLFALREIVDAFKNDTPLSRPWRSFSNVMTATMNDDRFTVRKAKESFPHYDYEFVVKVLWFNFDTASNIIYSHGRSYAEGLYHNLFNKLKQLINGEKEDTDETNEDTTAQQQPKQPTPTPTPTPTPMPPLDYSNLGEVKLKAINTMVQMYIEDKIDVLGDVKKLIKQEADKLNPHQIVINHKPTATISGNLHHKFERCLKLTIRHKQVFLSGPAGTGKTTLAEQIAEALGVKFCHISCTAGTSEGHLIGKMNAMGEYMIAAFVDCYENGGLFLFDEVDAADSNTMMVINSALANGNLSVPNRIIKQHAKRHPDFYCLCAANTWGFGSADYVGRNILDKAFLDRFPQSKIFIGYDVELEKKLSSSYPIIADTYWKIRKNVTDNKLQQVVSTRAIIEALKDIADGDTLKEIVETFLTGWSTEEQKKALTNITL